MKKLSLILNPIYPRMDHNSNLFLKVAPHINCEKEIVTINVQGDNHAHPKQFNGIPVYFAKNHKRLNRSVFHIGQLLSVAHSRKRKSKPTAVISTYQLRLAPFAASFMGKNVTKALYLMDPTENMCESETDVQNEEAWFLKMLSRYDVVFTTRFIKEAMLRKGYGDYAKRIVDVFFPMVTGFDKTPQQCDEKITLFFGGSIFYSFRSPEYFFKIVSKLDSRFRVIFVGDGCESVFDRFQLKSEAELIGLKHVEYEKMLQMMADSDILINIGNGIPVHIPSKTLEYINTGKPIVNFHKMEDCPTLYFTKRYPLCLNLSESDDDIDKVTQQFIDFCVNSKGKKLNQDWISTEYAECTAKEIAKTIETELFGK